MSNKLPDNIRYDEPAGSALLSKYQSQWEQIHANGENNLSKVRVVLDKVAELDKCVTSRLQAVTELLSSYKSLTELNNQINRIDSDLKNLDSCFEQIENHLDVLRSQKENLKLSRIRSNFEERTQTQISELKVLSEARRDKLKQDHFKRLDEIEKEEERILEERRQILQREFEEEKNRYLQGSRDSKQK